MTKELTEEQVKQYADMLNEYVYINEEGNPRVAKAGVHKVIAQAINEHTKKLQEEIERLNIELTR